MQLNSHNIPVQAACKEGLGSIFILVVVSMLNMETTTSLTFSITENDNLLCPWQCVSDRKGLQYNCNSVKQSLQNAYANPVSVSS